jgi:5-methylcytosine-specific restriction endonuclease McrA
MSARYQAYLRSLHWKQLSERIRRRDHYTCRDCGATSRLQVHHLCYRPNLEDALDSDLVTLCRDCHEKIHRKRVVRPARNTVVFGALAEKRKALMDGFIQPIPARSWLVRRLIGWLQN